MLLRTTYILSLVLIASTIFAQDLSKKINLQKYQQSDQLELTARELGNQWNAEAIQRSIDLYLEASEQKKEEGQFEKSADYLREVVNLYFNLGNIQPAIDLLNKIQIIDQKYSNQGKSIKTISLLTIAKIQLGKIDDALLLSNKLSTIIQKTGDSEAIASALYASGMVNYENGDFNKAKENYEKALLYWKQSGNLIGQAKTLRELAYCYLIDGQYQIGLEKAEESLNYSNQLGNPQLILLAENTVAFLKSNLGKKQEALMILFQSEKKFPNGVNPLEKGEMYSYLSGIYYDFNEINLALAYRIKAFELYRQVNHPFAQIASLSRLGLFSFQLGDEKNSLAYFDLGFKIARQIKSDYYTAVLNQDLGILYFEKDTKKSLEYCKKALRTFENLRTKSQTASMQNKIGLIAFKQGNYQLAKKLFLSSLMTNQRIKDQFEEAETIFNLAKIDLLENKTNEALKNISKSIDITEHLNSDVANSNLKRSYLSNVYERYELYINLLMQKQKESSNNDFAIQALQTSEKMRSRSMLETLRLSEANFTKDANPELVEKEKETRNLLNFKTDKLSSLLEGKTDKQEIDKIEDEIRGLQNNLENIKAEFKQNSPIYYTIKNPPPFDVKEFQENILDEKTVLLEFSLGEKESYLWLVGKSELKYYVLPDKKTIEERIDKIRKCFDEREILPEEDVTAYQNRISDLEDLFISEAKLLSNDLLGQAAEKLAGKRLLIVPDGKLYYLPFAALPFPNSNEFLISGNEIVYEPSASLLGLIAKTNSKQQSTKDLFVFADPVFNQTDKRLINKINDNSLPAILGLNLRNFRLTNADGSIPRLIASQEEAVSIQNIAGEAQTVIATGFAASRERLLNSDLSEYKILHFATHGLVDVERPEVSSIVLSLYDKNGNKIEGYLRLQDIYSFNLKTDLVVLSACRSGIGKEIKGEGLMSLNNAFLQAGAKSVLSSIWKVDDDATAEFMRRFYTNLINKGLNPSESLRRTQLEMIQFTQFKSPFYWAAFTLQGEFRKPIKISHSYFYPVLLGFAAIIGLMILLYFNRSRFYRMIKL